jgi:hypothetical protein
MLISRYVSGYYVGWYEGKALGDYYVCRYMGMVTTNVGWVFGFANICWVWALIFLKNRIKIIYIYKSIREPLVQVF